MRSTFLFFDTIIFIIQFIYLLICVIFIVKSIVISSFEIDNRFESYSLFAIIVAKNLKTTKY